jgi:SET domain-containing protein
MMLVRTYVAPSQIEGLGAYAAEPIKKGDLIWRFEPEFDRLLHRSVLDSSPAYMADYLRDYAYPHPVERDYFVVEIDNGRFVNHCETPNTDFSRVFEGYATRDIAVGEEITADYAQFDVNFRPGEFTPAEKQAAAAAGGGGSQVIFMNIEQGKRASRRRASRNR